MSSDLTEEAFDRAIKKIEEDSEWALRNPVPHIWFPEEKKMLKKIKFFEEIND